MNFHLGYAGNSRLFPIITNEKLSKRASKKPKPSFVVMSILFNKIPNSFKFMRRRSLRLLRPNPILNSDGDTGEFFRVKNYRREFFARKPGGLNSQVLPSELTL